MEEHEKHTLNPSFGLKQIQHTAAMMHSLWHHGENIYNDDQEADRYVARTRATYAQAGDGGIQEQQEEEIDTKRYKRDVVIPANQQMCAMGIPQYDVTLQNTCAGSVCTVQEVFTFTLSLSPFPFLAFPLLFKTSPFPSSFCPKCP